MQQPTLIDVSPVLGNRHTSDDRVVFDFYETPRAVTRAFANLIRIHLKWHPFVLEPCAGDRAIADVLQDDFGCRVITNDIDPRRNAELCVDAGNEVLYRNYPHPMPHWIISNPAFGEAGPIVAQAVKHARYATAMLLRMSFMEPVEDRATWLLENPPQHRLVTQRISFRKSEKGSGNDTVTTEWIIWTADRRPLAGVPPHGVLIWKP